MKQHIRMTDDEIRTIWRNRALADKQMVTCMADLNGCCKEIMLTKLEELGLVDSSKFTHYRDERPYSDEDIRRFKALLRMRCSVEVISQRLGRSKTSVTKKARELRTKGE